MAENIRRGTSPSSKNRIKTHCDKGHEYTPENTYSPPNGQRACRTCRRGWAAAERIGRPRRILRKPFGDRVEMFIERRASHWLWTGHVARTGPVLMDGKHKVLVKRWAFEQAGGTASTRIAVYSGCGEPLCINPEHMIARSRSEIVAEAKRRMAAAL